MFEHTLTGFKAQIETVKRGVALFELVDHAQALQVVLKAAVLGHAFVQRVLSGVAKRRVAQVVRQRHGFDQILVKTQGAGNGATQLRDFERVRQAGAEQVAFVVQKNLRFVD